MDLLYWWKNLGKIFQYWAKVKAALSKKYLKK
jgi:hypothetical protein